MRRILAGIFFLCFAFPVSSMAGEAHIILVQGNVEMKLPHTDQWQKADLNVVVSQGTELKTNEGGTCTLSFNSSNSRIVKVDDKTQVKVSEFQGDGVFLTQGRVFALIKDKSNKQPFEVRTPTAVAGARGTGWITEQDNLKTKVSCLDDVVYVAQVDQQGNIGEHQDLRAGLEIEIDNQTKSEAREVGELNKAHWKDFISESKDKFSQDTSSSDQSEHKGTSASQQNKVEPGGHEEGTFHENNQPKDGMNESGKGEEAPTEKVSEGKGQENPREELRDNLSRGKESVDPDLKDFIERRSDSGRVPTEGRSLSPAQDIREAQAEQKETVQEDRQIDRVEQKQTVQEQQQQQERETSPIESDSGSGGISGDSGSGGDSGGDNGGSSNTDGGGSGSGDSSGGSGGGPGPSVNSVSN